jgi:hypothetical protein
MCDENSSHTCLRFDSNNIWVFFGIYQGFTASAEGYAYKILDLLAGTLLI